MTTVGEVNKVEGLVIQWKIKNFFSLSKKVKKCYYSPQFSFADAVWSLKIYPNGDRESSKGYISLFLQRESSGRAINLDYYLGLKSFDEKIYEERHCTYVFKKIVGYGWFQFLNASILTEKRGELVPSCILTVVCRLQIPNPTMSGILHNSTTTKCEYCKINLEEHENLTSHQQKCMNKPIKCPECSDVIALKNWYDHKCQCAEIKAKCEYCKVNLEVHEDLTSHQQKCMDKPIKCPECSDVIALKHWYDHKCQKAEVEDHNKVLSDLKEIMLSGDHSDTVIMVKGEEFRLHKCVLSIRNPYFHAMFKNDMKEKMTGVVSIDDCEPDVFRSFIHFLYTGKTDKLSSENVCELYETAKKYQEEQLKNNCLHFMLNAVSVDNFCDFIALALRHDDKKLLQDTTKFFASKTKEIIRTVKWQKFLLDYPIQANELFIKALDYSDDK